jgi:hypothetical protein
MPRPTTRTFENIPRPVVLIGEPLPIPARSWVNYAHERYEYEQAEAAYADMIDRRPPGRLARTALAAGQAIARRTGIGRTWLPHPELNRAERAYIGDGYVEGRPQAHHGYLRLAYHAIEAAERVPYGELDLFVADNTWTDAPAARQIVALLNRANLIVLGRDVTALPVVPLQPAPSA